MIPPWPLRCYTDDDLGTYLRPGSNDCEPPPTSTVFAPVGATWTYTQRFAFAPDVSGLMVIECVGDTVIDGLTCSILEPPQGSGGCMPFHRFVTTMGDSVLFWCGADSSFQTLFVIGADIGDSWSMRADHGDSWINSDTLTWTVTDTGSTVIDGLTLRTLEVAVQATQNAGTASLCDGSIVERLGPSPFLFPWIFGACDGELNGPLRCYTDGDIDWLNPQFAQCALSVGVEERGEELAFYVGPNAFTLNAIRGNGTVQLSWTAGAGLLMGGLNNYEVVVTCPTGASAPTQGGCGVPINAGTSTTFTLTGLTNLKQYTIVVNARGSSNALIATSTTVSATPNDALTNGMDTTGVFRSGNWLLYLKNSNTTGFADVANNYGTAGDYPISGDWDGNGTATIGIYRNGSFYLRNSNTIGFADLVISFGQPGDQPVVGDWDGDGVDTIGIYRSIQALPSCN